MLPFLLPPGPALEVQNVRELRANANYVLSFEERGVLAVYPVTMFRKTGPLLRWMIDSTEMWVGTTSPIQTIGVDVDAGDFLDGAEGALAAGFAAAFSGGRRGHALLTLATQHSSGAVQAFTLGLRTIDEIHLREELNTVLPVFVESWRSGLMEFLLQDSFTDAADAGTFIDMTESMRARVLITAEAAKEVIDLIAQQSPGLDLPGTGGPDASSTAPATAGPGLAQQLAQIADLHRAGVLTDEEFAAAKRRVLGR